jgi:hypothetical protein
MVDARFAARAAACVGAAHCPCAWLCVLTRSVSASAVVRQLERMTIERDNLLESAKAAKEELEKVYVRRH